MRYNFSQIAALEYVVKKLGNLNADIFWNFNGQLVTFDIFQKVDKDLTYSVATITDDEESYACTDQLNTKALRTKFSKVFIESFNQNIKYKNNLGFFLSKATDLVQNIDQQYLNFDNVLKVFHNLKSETNHLDFYMFNDIDVIYPVSLIYHPEESSQN